MFGSGFGSSQQQQNPQQQQPQTSLFGGGNTGFGTFGAPSSAPGTGGFGAGGGFGTAPSTSSSTTPSFGFGAASTPQPTGGSLFGSGNTFGTLGGTPSTAVVPATGTANPPYTSTTEKDAPAGVTNHFHSISAMAAYKNFSFDVRVSAFGATPTTSTTSGGFGSSTTTPAFGASTTTTTPAFGASTTTPAFGAGTGFGASSTTTGFGAKPATTGFGGFGGTNTTFGSTGTTGTTSGGLFGSTQPKPATGFGNASTGTTGFGTLGSGGLSTGLGTSTTQPTVGTSGTGNFFGSASTTGGTSSLFGNKPAATTSNTLTASPFTQPSTTTGTGTGFGTGFGGFGAQKPATGGLFSTTPSTSGNVFGGFATNAQTTTGAGTSTGTGFTGFGNAAPKPPTFGGLGTQTGGTTGQTTTAPATGGLFSNLGSTQQPSTTNTMNTTGTTGGSGFTGFSFGSNKPATASTPGFSLSTPAPAGGTGSTFSLTGTTSGAQPGTTQAGTFTLQPPKTTGVGSSVEQTPYGTLSIFNAATPTGTTAAAAVTPAPSGTPISTIRKKPTTPHYKHSPQPASRLKPRVYTPATHGTLTTPITKTPLHIFEGLNKHEALKPDAFVRKPKGLVIDNNKVPEIGLMSASKADETTTIETTTNGSGISRSEFKTPEPKAGPSKSPFETGFDLFKHNQIIGKLGETSKTSSPFKTPTHTPVKTPNPRLLSQQTPDQFLSEPSTPSPIVSRKNGISQNGKARAEESSSSSRGDGYWMSPSLDELKSMDKEDIKHVSHFQVGRSGHGQVSFDDEVDLSSIPLEQIPGKIVQFVNRTCIVYQDGCGVTKPPVGQGLNRPAKITIQGCWALDKSTRKPITDPNDPRFRQRINRLKATPETTFIDFFADTGSWLFHVRHFSKYGLELDSEEDEYEEREFKPHHATPTSQIRNDENTPFSTPSSNSKDASKKTTTPAKAFSETLRLDPNRVFQMTNTLFPSSSDKQNVIATSDFYSPSPNTRGKRNIDTSLEMEIEPVPDLGEKVESRKSFVTIPPPIPQTQFIFRGRPAKFRRINYSESISYQKDGLVADAGLAMSRSFRVGWGPNGTFVHCGTVCGINTVKWRKDSSLLLKETETGLPTTIYFEKLKMFADPDEEREKSRHIQMLKSLLQNSTISRDKNGIPYVSTNSNHTYSVFAKVTKNSKVFTDHERSLWRLAQILFDDLDLDKFKKFEDDPDRKEVELQKYRKKGISEWLEAIVKKKAETHVNECIAKQNTYGTIIAHLSQHQIGQAALKAVQNHDLHLATLIPQLLSCDPQFRYLIEQQLNHWEATGVVNYISNDYWIVYQILASHILEVNVSQKLDWKRSLAMHVWYGLPIETEFKEVFEQYDDSFQKEEELSSPIVWYNEEKSNERLLTWKNLSSDTNDQQQKVYDVLYHLLKLFVEPAYPLEDILFPQSITPSPIDYRVSWFLQLLLTRSTEEDDDTLGNETLFNSVTCSFMSQLERLGLWEWALFVGLHFKDGKIRERIIKDLLTRYWPLTKKDRKDSDDSAVTEIHDFLINRLKLNENDIAMAKVIEAKYHGNIYMEAKHCLEVGLYAIGHDLIIKEFAPEAILHEKYGILYEFLEQIDSSAVPNWISGGALYMNIIDLINDFVEKLPEVGIQEIDKDELNRLCHEILNVLETIQPENRLQERCFASVEMKAQEMLKTLDKALRHDSMAFSIDEEL
ncbi:2125_t:CDS:10 [Ambispora gerdemannii]|uniref:2125_t:CDS:1 n=1 Tax=Ambispora gerdemannii TaxID=144530 RepID=A0A9N9F3Q5_9GLOM|nr:2125_t:CDS:10 [Ambispora gerdemannii]